MTGTSNGVMDGHDIIDDCVNDADDVCVTDNNDVVDCVNIVDDTVTGIDIYGVDIYDKGTRSGFIEGCIKGTSRGPSGGFVTGTNNCGGRGLDPTSNVGIPADCDVGFVTDTNNCGGRGLDPTSNMGIPEDCVAGLSKPVSKCFDSLNFTSSELLTFLSQYAELIALQRRRTLMETKPSCFKINFSTLDWSVHPIITLLICNNRNIKIM